MYYTAHYCCNLSKFEVIFQLENLTAKKRTEILNEDTRNRYNEKMDNDISCVDDVDDEIEIVEVKPDLYGSFDEVWDLTETEAENVDRHSNLDCEDMSKDEEELKSDENEQLEELAEENGSLDDGRVLSKT